MSLCMFSRRAPTSDAMSFGDIGGNGPPHHSNAAPVPPTVQSVRRSLFGPVDHVQTRRDLEEESRKCDQQSMREYNFDFARQQPIATPDARYEWTPVSTANTTDATDQQTRSTNACKAVEPMAAPTTQSSAVRSTDATDTPAVTTTATTAGNTTSSTNSTSNSTSVSSVDATSVSISLDAECMARGSAPRGAHIDASDANKSDITAKLTKQSQITVFLRGRKSGENERKRSGAKSVCDEDSTARLPVKRRRPDASRPDPSAALAAQRLDADDEESVQT